jgi:hypothetical protein
VLQYQSLAVLTQALTYEHMWEEAHLIEEAQHILGCAGYSVGRVRPVRQPCALPMAPQVHQEDLVGWETLCPRIAVCNCGILHGYQALVHVLWGTDLCQHACEGIEVLPSAQDAMHKDYCWRGLAWRCSGPPCLRAQSVILVCHTCPNGCIQPGRIVCNMMSYQRTLDQLPGQCWVVCSCGVQAHHSSLKALATLNMHVAQPSISFALP